MNPTTRTILIGAVVVAVLVGAAFFQFGASFLSPHRLSVSVVSGTVKQIAGDTISINGTVRQSASGDNPAPSKLVTLAVTPETRYIKTAYVLDPARTTAYAPAFSEGPGALSDIVPGIRIIAASSSDDLISHTNGTATVINYAVFSFTH